LSLAASTPELSEVPVTTNLTAPTGGGRPDPAEAPARVERVIATLPCTYCLADIAGRSFCYRSSIHRFVEAPCPSCGRWMTLSAATWRRWTTSAPHRAA